jgi:predicted  nucleic acid-binding Zn-ribbon protein
VIEELSKLLELQELDLEIQRIADRLASIPSERELIETKYREQSAEFLELKQQYDQTIASRKQFETELADTQESHDKYKQDLMRVRNEKEYVTALREIDATKKLISTLETEILKAIEGIEKLEGDIKVFEPEIERKRAEIDRDLEALAQEQAGVDSRLATINERRQQLTSTVPANLLQMYERVAKIRRGQALSEVVDGICTACRMRMRPKVYSDVRRGDQLITCDNCARILFYRPNLAESVEIAMGQ